MKKILEEAVALKNKLEGEIKQQSQKAGAKQEKNQTPKEK